MRAKYEALREAVIVDAVICRVFNVRQDRVDVELAPGGTWLTVLDADLPRRPRAGDVLRIRRPQALEILGIDAKGEPHD